MQETPIGYKLEHQLVFGTGNKLKTVREFLGLTVDQLAAMSGLDRQTICFMETHRLESRNLDLQAVSSVLGVDEELLLDNSMWIDRGEESLLQDILLQTRTAYDLEVLPERIFNWLAVVLHHNRRKWNRGQYDVFKTLCLLKRYKEAHNSGQIRDKKYASFREYFKNLQRQKFLQAQQQGRMLSANAFANWFLEHLPDDVEIPYCPSNRKNKLIQLAQANNREFKKAFACKS